MKNLSVQLLSSGNKTDEFLPGYCCQCEEYACEVENSPTDAFSNLYQNIYKTSTRISGAKKNVKLFVYDLGISNNNEFCGVGNGYISCFNHAFESKWCTFIQKIIDDNFVVEIWFENSLLKKIDAWKEIRILTKLEGKKIAGLDSDATNKILQDP
nr:100_t:CDS:2 [Entrophospora candida]